MKKVWTPEEIQARVGTAVSADEMSEMLSSTRIGTSPNDVRVMGEQLHFSFGSCGVRLDRYDRRDPV